jgi:hypothetical protein
MVREIYSLWNIDREGFKWNINELLRLEREYDLLELSVVKIAKLHQRTTTAIAMKLQSEGIISNFKEARGFKESLSDSDSDSDGEIFFASIDDNSVSDCCSEYIPSETEYNSDSDYSPEYYKSYAKKYIQNKNDITQSVYESDYETKKDDIKNKITIYDSDSSVEIIENNVKQRVDKLETSVSNMEGMLTKMYNFITSHSSSLSMGYDM